MVFSMLFLISSSVVGVNDFSLLFSKTSPSSSFLISSLRAFGTSNFGLSVFSSTFYSVSYLAKAGVEADPSTKSMVPSLFLTYFTDDSASVVYFALP